LRKPPKANRGGAWAWITDLIEKGEKPPPAFIAHLFRLTDDPVLRYAADFIEKVRLRGRAPAEDKFSRQAFDGWLREELSKNFETIKKQCQEELKKNNLGGECLHDMAIERMLETYQAHLDRMDLNTRDRLDKFLYPRR